MKWSINGKVKDLERPEPVKTPQKEADKYIYTLSTKNALKLSNYVTDKLSVKIGDKIAYVKDEDKIYIFKTTQDDPLGYPLTKLGINKSFVRLNHSMLWAELKGDEKFVNQYELGEEITAVDDKGKETDQKAYLLVFVKKENKQASGKKIASTGKGKGQVKRIRKAQQVEQVETQSVITFDLPLKKVQ